MSNTTPTITPSCQIKLPPSLCPQHNLPFQTYCSHQKCQTRIRVCKNCTNHQSHIKFITDKKEVISDLNKGLKRCFQKIIDFDQRSKELMKVMKLAETRTIDEYEQMQKQLIRLVKDDKQQLEHIVKKMSDNSEMIQQRQRVKTYFTKLNAHKLLSLRVQLSTAEGITNFREKNVKLREMTSKSSSEQLRLLYDELNRVKQQFDRKLQNNLTFKLGQVIAMKNCSKQVEAKGKVVREKGVERDAEKENAGRINVRREKPRAKTTLNFGNGIITGILNFLNF